MERNSFREKNGRNAPTGLVLGRQGEAACSLRKPLAMNFPKPFPAPPAARLCLDVKWETRKRASADICPKSQHTRASLVGITRSRDVSLLCCTHNISSPHSSGVLIASASEPFQGSSVTKCTHSAAIFQAETAFEHCLSCKHLPGFLRQGSGSWRGP